MRRFGLLGQTLKHSFSQAFFTEKFRREGRTDHQYENFELDTVRAFPALLERYPDLAGLNVTIPYKRDILAYLQELDEPVLAMGACNCIRIRDGKLEGFNTDHLGFARSLQPLLGPQHTRALVLGTGGAAQAVLYALGKLGIGVSIVSRSGDADFTYATLTTGDVQAHPLIINTTPLGTWPQVDDLPSIPYEGIGPQHLLYDLVYNPEVTAFLRNGQERGAVIKNGHEMLVLQAEASWELWNRE
ncbi:shikimate dehydrogenase [Flaviaesturariibacter amylovorans]|uniref:Shikimate dehydrogenase n=1 Tax=Flaviaesturariibacter amylovorans TaxID=1084520 RepID=A0ABP8GMQ2_9BACT